MDYNSYKKEIEHRIEQLDAKMDELKASGRQDYHELMADYESKKRDLVSKLDNGEKEASNGWEDFKNRIDQSIDSLDMRVRDVFDGK